MGHYNAIIIPRLHNTSPIMADQQAIHNRIILPAIDGLDHQNDI